MVLYPKHLFKLTTLFCLTSFLAISTNAMSNSRSLDDDLALFLEWFTGEFDNNEQVWQQGVDGVAKEDQHEHIHHIFLPVSAPEIGEKTFFVKQYQDGDYNNVYRQRLYSFTADEKENAIRLAIYTFKDEEKYSTTDKNTDLISRINKDELKNTPGCDVFWSLQDDGDEDYFLGVMKDKACFYYSTRMEKNIYISDTLKLTPSEIWIGDKAFDEEGNKIFGRDEQHKNRKVRHFKGWAAIKNSELDPDAENPDDYTFIAGLRWHNEGGKAPLITKEGVDTGYTVELARLTYQNTGVAILKLGLIENETGKTAKYIWANPDAKQIGMNLRWIQVGATEE